MDGKFKAAIEARLPGAPYTWRWDGDTVIISRTLNGRVCESSIVCHRRLSIETYYGLIQAAVRVCEKG